MVHKVVRCMCVGWLIVGLLAACAGDGGDEDNAPQGPSSSPIAFASPPLLIWHPFSGAGQDALEQIRLDFEVAHPQIDVVLQAFDPATLRNEFAGAVRAGAGPDVLLGPADWMVSLTQEGHLRPVSPELFERITSHMNRSAAFAGEIGSDLYGIPVTAQVATLYTNKALVDFPPTTYADLLDQAPTLGMLITPSFSALGGLYLSGGRSLIDGRARVLMTEVDLTGFLAKVKQLAETPGVTFSTDYAPFLGGEVGLLLASSNDYPALAEALGGDLEVAVLPQIQPDPWQPLIDLQFAMQSINTTTEGEANADEFVVFLTAPAAQLTWFQHTGLAPVNTADLGDAALRLGWGQSMLFGVPAPLVPEYDAVMRPALDDAVRAVAAGERDPASAAADALSAFAQITPRP